MLTKKQITDALREGLSDVAERGRILGQALKVRADIALTRRRLRAVFAALGEEVYAGMNEGQDSGEGDALADFKKRIDGLKAELQGQEAELHDLMQSREAAVEEEK